MIKYFIIALSLLLFSCINIITEEEFYESIYLENSGWFEFYDNTVGNDLNVSQNYTFQLWFSGKELSDLEAACILNINDTNLNLSIYRNSNINNQLTIYLNDQLAGEITIESVDFNNENNFYLLSVIVDNQTLSIYFNENQILQENINQSLNPSFIVGAYKSNDTISNLWYGYIDEIRIWNQSLSQDVIEFHNEYKYKVSSSYEDDYLDALIGLWCFRLNVEGETASNIFRDENDSNNYSILYTYGISSNELSTNGR